MEARKKLKQPGFAALMKEFLRTDLFKCILCGNRLRFSSALAGRHATEITVFICSHCVIVFAFR